MKTSILLSMTAAVALTFTAAQVVAESHSEMNPSEMNPSDAVAKRIALMGSIGDQTKALVGMVRGAPLAWDVISAAGDNTQMVAETMPTLFVEGSFMKPSTASEAIELDLDGITERFEKLGMDGKALSDAAAAEDPAAFKEAFGAYISNCKACHSEYRI